MGLLVEHTNNCLPMGNQSTEALLSEQSTLTMSGGQADGYLTIHRYGKIAQWWHSYQTAKASRLERLPPIGLNPADAPSALIAAP